MGFFYPVERGVGAPRKRERKEKMAKISPGQYVRQVRQEISKVVWPTRRETIVTTIMVFIMITLAALFFMFVDYVFSELVQLILPNRF